MKLGRTWAIAGIAMAVIALPAAPAQAFSSYCSRDAKLTEKWDLFLDQGTYKILGHVNVYQSQACGTVQAEAWLNSGAQLSVTLSVVGRQDSAYNTGKGHVTTPEIAYRYGSTSYRVSERVLSGGVRYQMISISK